MNKKILLWMFVFLVCINSALGVYWNGTDWRGGSFQIDDFESEWGNWSGDGDGGHFNASNQTTYVEEGSYGINLTLNTSKSVSDYGYWTKTYVQRDISPITGVSSGTPTNGTLKIKVYILNVEERTSAGKVIYIKVGNGNSNHVHYTWYDTVVNDGWNYLEVNLSDFSSVGTPDWTKFNWTRIFVWNNDTADTEEYILSTYFDDLKVFLTGAYNSVNITIYDEDTGSLILQDASIRFLKMDSNESEFTGNTDTGNFYIYDLDTAKYKLLFSSDDYLDRSHIMTIGEGSSQNLKVYLPNASTAQNTIFTIIDQDTSATLEDVFVSMYRRIDGDWQTIESKYTDLTGKVQLAYLPSPRYKFFLSKIPYYTDRVFYLDPVLFSQYTIHMIGSTTSINYSQDYDKLAIIYSPDSFPNETITTFDFMIASPTGLLINYGYTITYPDDTDTQTGSNAIGGQLTSEINITGAEVFDNVVLDYYYNTTLSGRRNFTAMLPISFITGARGNMTFMANIDRTYGLGIFERMFISTLTVLFVVGIATMVGQPLPGFILGLMVFGFMSYIGFIPLWGILPSMFIGVFFLLWKSGG